MTVFVSYKNNFKLSSKHFYALDKNKVGLLNQQFFIIFL